MYSLDENRLSLRAEGEAISPLRLLRRFAPRNDRFFISLFLMAILSGCSAVQTVLKKAEPKTHPKILVMGFHCDNGKIGGDIVSGLVANLSSKMDGYDSGSFEVFIASMTRKKEREGAKGKYTIKFSSSIFDQELTRSQYFRSKVNLEMGLDYVVTGEAKEQKLSDLEQGNLVTAESASMKLMELRTGQVLLTDDFKQGFFEIVAADRIGAKFAASINKYFGHVAKEEKREEKELLKSFHAE